MLGYSISELVDILVFFFFIRIILIIIRQGIYTFCLYRCSVCMVCSSHSCVRWKEIAGHKYHCQGYTKDSFYSVSTLLFTLSSPFCNCHSNDQNRCTCKHQIHIRPGRIPRLYRFCLCCLSLFRLRCFSRSRFRFCRIVFDITCQGRFHFRADLQYEWDRIIGVTIDLHRIPEDQVGAVPEGSFSFACGIGREPFYRFDSWMGVHISL